MPACAPMAQPCGPLAFQVTFCPLVVVSRSDCSPTMIVLLVPSVIWTSLIWALGYRTPLPAMIPPEQHPTDPPPALVRVSLRPGMRPLTAPEMPAYVGTIAVPFPPGLEVGLVSAFCFSGRVVEGHR